MRRVLSIFFAYIVFAFSTAVFAETARFGAIASLTGAAAEHGNNWMQGALLAYEELKVQGKEVELIMENDESSAAKVASAFQKLASVNKVNGIIGGTFDYLAEPAYPLAKQYRIPFITPTNPSELLSSEALQNPFVFTNSLAIEAEKKAARALVEKLGVKRVAVVVPAIPWGIAHGKMFDDLIREFNLELVYRSEFPIEGSYQDTIKVDALKISKIKPDLIFAIHHYQDLELFLVELERLKFSPYVLSNQHVDKALELSKKPERYKKVFGIYPETILHKDFSRRYKEKYGTDAKVYAAEGYDALYYLFRLHKAKIDLQKPGTSFSIPGIAGTLVFPPKQRAIVDNKAVIMSAQGGIFSPWKA